MAIDREHGLRQRSVGCHFFGEGCCSVSEFGPQCEDHLERHYCLAIPQIRAKTSRAWEFSVRSIDCIWRWRTKVQKIWGRELRSDIRTRESRLKRSDRHGTVRRSKTGIQLRSVADSSCRRWMHLDRVDTSDRPDLDLPDLDLHDLDLHDLVLQLRSDQFHEYCDLESEDSEKRNRNCLNV